MDTLQEELHSVDTRINNNITQVNTTLSSELTSINTNIVSMNKLFSDDFNDVKIELNGINDTTNEIVDEIEDQQVIMEVLPVVIMEALFIYNDST